MQAPSGPEWELACDSATFQQCREQQAFHRLLTLARIANTIRFAQTVVAEAGDADSPRAVRQRSSALFYLAAVLFEALAFANRLGEFYRDSPAFREGFAAWLGDHDVRELREGILSRLRNQAVFHHDDDVPAVGVGTIQSDRFVFASGSGRLRLEGYYDLADIAVMSHALGGATTVEEFGSKVRQALIDVVALGARFAGAADRLIAAELAPLGWQLSQVAK